MMYEYFKWNEDICSYILRNEVLPYHVNRLFTKSY